MPTKTPSRRSGLLDQLCTLNVASEAAAITGMPGSLDTDSIARTCRYRVGKVLKALKPLDCEKLKLPAILSAYGNCIDPRLMKTDAWKKLPEDDATLRIIKELVAIASCQKTANIKLVNECPKNVIIDNVAKKATEELMDLVLSTNFPENPSIL